MADIAGGDGPGILPDMAESFGGDPEGDAAMGAGDFSAQAGAMRGSRVGDGADCVRVEPAVLWEIEDGVHLGRGGDRSDGTVAKGDRDADPEGAVSSEWAIEGDWAGGAGVPVRAGVVSGRAAGGATETDPAGGDAGAGGDAD